MTYAHALILSLVEGVTEFLPVSSTGHLVIAAEFLNIEQTEFVKTFEIVIQLGAIFAAVVLYARRIAANFSLTKKIIIASVPSAIVGILFYDLIKTYLLGNTLFTAAALFFGGIALICFDLFVVNKKIDAKQIPTNQQATIIGLFQTLALIPGVSRSGATIVGGVLSGLSRSSAVEFSFMLAIPLMLGATALDLVRTDAVIGPHELQLLAIGFVGSFLSALAVIKLFIAFVSRRTFLWFGIYRIAVASLVILF
ncbi:MAG: hypothetical protein A3C15_03250 [Candidatus Magasanikbacteria bacterium RIFCSPHIGHO2_02_FULL_50_9b]|uniref:Undecaprenyl-diphosphatase n=1 Tax=Candidatus Magasanikbacteria bacterium RIFCSPHIGHO2_02_FULL_50_9b TaxID=1798682 RepID=A0A1F6M7G6_9BACT|nr:MAG: hypothetical protein A3C15_03250 [Candidatus Magasanikbacteria bacterium RIFCSPHIGHO2_02_FULL_50_9b]